MISDATSVLGLQQEIQRSKESRYDHRLHSVLLVRDGQFLFRRETGRFNGETIWEFLQVCFGKPVPFPTAAFWPSATTHHIIAPNSIGGGATSRLPSSAWTSCRPIARI